MARVVAGLLAAVVAAGGLSVAGCSPGPVTPLPDAPPASQPGRATPSAAARVPVPDDANAAVPDIDPDRAVSPAQGTVRLAVQAARPAGPAAAPYRAYVGWVRSYLRAYAAPGRPDTLASYGTPTAARTVRGQAAALATRGWAEYGSARLVSATVRVTGATAIVQSCLDLSGLATRDAAGRLAGRDRPVRSTATLTATAGRWLVGTDKKASVPRCG